MIQFHGISYEIAGRSLFQNLNGTLAQKAYGLVGPNGVGKSTFARILAGELLCDEGSVRRSGRVIYFAQDEWIPPEQNPMSGGEWARLRLQRLLETSRKDAFFILDEPTNHLDHEAREEFRRRIGMLPAYLLISHDRSALNQVDEIWELSNQGLSRYGGNFSFYEKEREAERTRQASLLHQSQKQKEKVLEERREKVARQEKRMRSGNEQAKKGGTPKILLGTRKSQAQKSVGKLSLQESKLIEAADHLARQAWSDTKLDPFIRFDFDSHRPSESKIHFLISDPQTLCIRGSERWRISGRNGSGKTTLLKRIVAKVESGGAAFAYLDQVQSTLDLDLPLLDQLLSDSRFTVSELRNELAFFGFTGAKVLQTVGTFSGGERLKAALAQAFLGKKIPEMLILDEPTNNLDLGSLALLEEALTEFKGAIVLVSHDEVFVEKVGIDHELKL